MINMPYIKFVVLRNNYITRVGVLRKARWRDIEQVNLRGNWFVEYGRINEICGATSNGI